MGNVQENAQGLTPVGEGVFLRETLEPGALPPQRRGLNPWLTLPVGYAALVGVCIGVGLLARWID